MLLHMLSHDDQKIFMQIARLLSLSDNPLLFDGKPHEELTANSDLSKISIEESEAELAVLKGFARECGNPDVLGSLGAEIGKATIAVFSSLTGRERIPTITAGMLIDELGNIPLKNINDPAERLPAAIRVLRKIWGERQDSDKDSPAIAKVMLFDLMLMILADENVTDIEFGLLKEFASLTRVEDFVFDDLLERAKAFNAETSKTIALVLE